ncbi:MAG: hypothetical protein Q9227_004687 [Pyrenula ochraceoflavens]
MSANGGSTLSPTSSRPDNSRSPQRLGSIPRSHTAPDKMAVNGHMASVGKGVNGVNGAGSFEHGVQVIDEDKEFNPDFSKYLTYANVTPSGFNYHLISVFGSQSTGKSTLLNYLFGTEFSVMSEAERRQTTKGIWLSKNRNTTTLSTGPEGPQKMADNILVMDVEGTDGRERGEDQDFERKAALFALATSEVLIVNIWEHQVGLYQGANMGLLKTVFEVNLQLFLKDRKTTHRSLLFFVIRDFLGTTPLQNLRNTLMQDLTRIWASLSKPPGLEKSRIEDYFDFAFSALPHKLYQPEKFESEVKRMTGRFRESPARDPRKEGITGKNEFEGGVFLPEYHRRIPADGFPHYAESIWDQINNNKDLDLPTQQELLAQFRCDEIAREVLISFDTVMKPFEERQSDNDRKGNPQILGGLGPQMRSARAKILSDFQTNASRYHKAVYQRKLAELSSNVDSRLKMLFKGQLSAAHKQGVMSFSDAVTSAVKTGQKKGTSYDFAAIVSEQKRTALSRFDKEAKAVVIEGLPWSNYQQELTLYKKDLDEVSARLRRDEMRRLATRVERWVRSHLNDSVGLEFNALGSGRGGSGAPESGSKPPESGIWDRIWDLFVSTVSEAEHRFADRARSFDASPEEVEVGIWRLRRKSWCALREKIGEEMMEGNLLLKLRENFEDKFRYDEAGVPRIWRPTDDIEGIYTKARESTLSVIPLLARFRLRDTGEPPDLDDWIGKQPAAATPEDEEDLQPIGGVDEEEGGAGAASLEEEVTMLPEGKRADLIVRFKKAADGVYVEAKRSAIGGMTQVPLYFYGILLALGWNEIVAVLRNPAYFLMLALLAIGAYVTYTLNLWGPMIKMANAASAQAVQEGKKKLREFLEESQTGREALAMSSGSGSGEEYEMGRVRRRGGAGDGEDEEGDEI